MGPAPVWAQDLSHFTPSSAEIDRVAGSQGWLRLLHYRAPFLRSARSDVVNPEFFLGPEGRTDPRRELEATLRAALGRQSAICAFPARIEFLKAEFGGEFARALPKIQCPDFDKWRAGIQAKSVSLVYSSAYPGNPASMFGHTFLRLDRRAGGEESLTHQMDLFSYGVNFSASVSDGENPIKYAMYGLFGGYVGRYDLAPYYRKVNEYAFSESRDLWEYRLQFSERETEQLVRHLWELYTAGFFKYYFLDENCSFQILTALEAVKPEWNLSRGFILSAIPIETVKHLFREKDAVEKVTLRPALRARRDTALDRLAPEELRRVEALFREDEKVGDSDSAEVLDALGLALTYEKTVAGDSFKRGEYLKTVWFARSRKPKKAIEEVVTDESRRPDTSHGTSRLTLGGGVRSRDKNSVATFSFSGFEHGFLDRTPSFNPFSEVRILKFDFEKEEKRNPEFQAAHLIEMASFAPRSVFDGAKSWRVGIGWSRVPDLVEHSGGVWKGEGGYGLGQNVFGRNHLVYLLAAGELEHGSALSKAFRFSPGLESGLIANPIHEKYFIHLRAQALYDLTAVSERRWRWRFELSQAYAPGADWSLRLSLSRVSFSKGAIRDGDEASVRISWMY